ncbi:hypothetical protein ICY20_23965 [Pseudomonas sp. P115]|uniref:hypothetical protein n=1 Tax=Pseudomonas pisciculturae TaxID=2730413 RepID=UPI00189259FB|nr:hypothetical protein [Pseudomonas pisciculturae]MBF6030809.1 hypothetical protein [Pseudomonas pisciculturae]
MNPTIEELMLQILSTCLLINAQGKWHAFYNLSGHVGTATVTLRPIDHDYDSKGFFTTPHMDVVFASTTTWPERITEVEGQRNLIDLLAWTQGYLAVEAAA